MSWPHFTNGRDGARPSKNQIMTLPLAVYRCQSHTRSLYCRRIRCADVAELADAQPSGGCDRKVVEVQLLSSAPNIAWIR